MPDNRNTKLPVRVLEIAETLASEMMARGIGPEQDVGYPASQTLMRDLYKEGFTAHVYELKGFRGSTARAHPRWIELMTLLKSDRSMLVHFLTVVDDYAIDLTFQQFDLDAPAVRIISMDDLRAEWDHVQRI